MGFLGQIFLGTGELPTAIRSELESECLVLAEEGLSGSVRYSNFKAPGKRFNGKVTPVRIGVGVSEVRIVAFCASGRGKLMNSRWDSTQLAALDVSFDGRKTVDFHIDYSRLPAVDAGGVSGEVTIRVRTQEAARLAEAVQARLPSARS